jgi:hypothetical protein
MAGGGSSGEFCVTRQPQKSADRDVLLAVSLIEPTMYVGSPNVYPGAITLQLRVAEMPIRTASAGSGLSK